MSIHIDYQRQWNARFAFERRVRAVCAPLGLAVAFATGIVFGACSVSAQEFESLGLPPLTLDRSLDLDPPLYERYTPPTYDRTPNFAPEDPRMQLPRVSPTPAQPGLNYVYPGGGDGHPDLYVSPDGRMDYLYRYGGDR